MDKHEAGRSYGYVKEFPGGICAQEQVKSLENYVPAKNLIAERLGKDSNSELQMLKQVLRAGDTFYAVSPACFSRSLRIQIKELRWMQRHDIYTHFLVLPSTLSASSDSEERLVRSLLIEVLVFTADQDSAIQKCISPTLPERKNGQVGRPKTPIPEGFNKIYGLWIEQKISTAEAIRRSGLKRSTFYNITKELSRSKSNSKHSAVQATATNNGGQNHVKEQE